MIENMTATDAAAEGSTLDIIEGTVGELEAGVDALAEVFDQLGGALDALGARGIEGSAPVLEPGLALALRSECEALRGAVGSVRSMLAEATHAAGVGVAALA